MIVTRRQFDPDQLNTISQIAAVAGVSVRTASIVFARGIDTVEKAKRFFSPGAAHFSSPFALKGVKEAVERITRARDEGETVVVYGDYDVDGVCASTILVKALAVFGIAADAVVPERSDGYGLSEKQIDDVMERYNPDLIITVDCGISSVNEVEYIQSLGVDVIVTDHHELPEVLPDCTTVNCKLPGQDVFEFLCGAGVAFKLAEALIGKAAYSYLDLAALATVADSMPLVDENRDIVYEGLKIIASSNTRRAIAALIEISKIKEITSTTLAYSIAPRINAAGRMNDAAAALRLFMSEDDGEIETLAARLNDYNARRQAECDALYRSARAKLMKKGAYDRAIVLEDSGWNNGIVGIVAAKLVEEFSRPVILFAGRDGLLHGSARSVDDINILDAIARNKEFLVEFGGHAQAAGVTIKAENLPAFERGLNDYLKEKYPRPVTAGIYEVEFIADSPVSVEFAKELELLEPFGTGNKKPLFALNAPIRRIDSLKAGTDHITVSTDIIELIYFHGAQYGELLNAPVGKTIVFETNVSRYNGKDSLRGYIKGFETELVAGKDLGLELFMKNVQSVLWQNAANPVRLSEEQIGEKIEASLSEPYGTVYAASTLKSLQNFPSLTGLPVCLGAPRSRNLSACVVIVPSGEGLEGYRRMIYLDEPLAYPPFEGEIFVNGDLTVASMLPEVTATRQAVGEVYSLITGHKYIKANSSRELYFKLEKVPQISRYQFVFAVEVFAELGLVSFSKGKLTFAAGGKRDLKDSRIFVKFGG